jgi:hypothetical protein
VTGELAAIVITLQEIPHFRPVEIATDSKYTANGLTAHLRNWEDIGWIGIQNAALFRKAAFLMKQRSTKTSFSWVKAHNGTLGNEESDRLAKEGAEKGIPDILDLQIPPEFNLQGAKMQTINQRTAYKGILKKRPKPPHPDATEYIQAIKTAIEETNGTKETTATVWKSLRRPIFRPRVQQFLFKSIHKTFMIGDKWKDIQNFEQRQMCTICNKVELMKHILLECDANTQNLIWVKAKELWPQEWHEWPNVTIGTILGIGLISSPRNERRQANGNRMMSTGMRGQTRLLQILISEVSHLIWVLRCEQVIHMENRQHADQEVNARWIKVINDRLTTDRITTTKIKRDETYTQLINATWKKSLNKHGIPHHNWLQH